MSVRHNCAKARTPVCLEAAIAHYSSNNFYAMAMDSRDSEEKAAPPPPPAPFLQIPSRAISVVEHPCIIKNIDKGLLSLGGPVKLSKVRSPLSLTTSMQLTPLLGLDLEARSDTQPRPRSRR